MLGKKHQKPLTAVEGGTTLIARDTTIMGDIVFSGNLDVEGRVIGSIVAEPGKDALLRILDGGEMEGEVRVPAAIVNGKVDGDIHVSGRIELAECAHINGEVFYKLIEMAVGCKVEGGLHYVDSVSEGATEQRKAEPASAPPSKWQYQ
jgi:cytoskeletal protein CcmA (bactofilin family)